MYKKIICGMLTLSLLCVLFCAPVQADTVSDYLKDYIYFNADFSKGAVADSTGNYVYDLSSGVSFVYDGLLGTKTLELDGEGALEWYPAAGETLIGYDLSQGITVEALVYMSTDPDLVKNNMVVFETCDDAIHFAEYNNGYEQRAEFTCGDRYPCGKFKETDAYISQVFPRLEWVHIVGTSDTEVTKLFINGSLENSIGRNRGDIHSEEDTGDNKVYIGGSRFGNSNFSGRIAFVKIYKTAISNAMAKRMYKEVLAEIPAATVEVEAGTTVWEYTESVTDLYSVEVYNDGALAEEESKLCTGMKMKLTDKTTSETVVYGVSVSGDVTGDGEVGSIDYLKVKKCLTYGIDFEGAFYEAADANNDGHIKSVDYVRIKRSFQS